MQTCSCSPAQGSRDKPSWKIIPRLSFLTISQFLLSPSPQPKRVRIIHNTSFMARLIPRCVCPGTLQYTSVSPAELL